MNPPPYLKADFHTHPLGDKYCYQPSWELSSRDRESISRFLRAMHTSGLHLLACVDHHSVASGLWAREEAIRLGCPFTVIPGAEVAVRGASQSLHLLAYNIYEDLPSQRLALEDAAERIRRQGGIAVLAHPVKYPQELKMNPGVLSGLDGIETYNASEGVFRAERYLDESSRYLGRHLQQTGGSDFHWDPGREAFFPQGLYRQGVPFQAPTGWLLEKGLISGAKLQGAAFRQSRL